MEIRTVLYILESSLQNIFPPGGGILFLYPCVAHLRYSGEGPQTRIFEAVCGQECLDRCSGLCFFEFLSLEFEAEGRRVVR